MGRQARALTSERFGAGRLVADTRELYTSIAVDRGWIRSREDVRR
jgi:hypothetical protein